MTFWVDDITDMLSDFGETFFIENIGNDVGSKLLSIPTYKTIPHSDHVVANVDRRRDTITAMQCLIAIAEGIIVFDIVMHERRLVERLDRHGGAANGVRKTSNVGAAGSERSLASR